MAAPTLSRPPGSPQRQTKTLLAIGFGGLLLLMGVLSASSISFLYPIEKRHETIRQDYVKRDTMLEKIRAGIYVSGTDFRDFVMDDDEARAARDRAQFLAAETETRSRTADYERLFHPAGEKAFQEFRSGLKAYFETLAPALAWKRAAAPSSCKQHHRRAVASAQDAVDQPLRSGSAIERTAVGSQQPVRQRYVRFLPKSAGVDVHPDDHHRCGIGGRDHVALVESGAGFRRELP